MIRGWHSDEQKEGSNHRSAAALVNILDPIHGDEKTGVRNDVHA